jgi:hypothetical protein
VPYLPINPIHDTTLPTPWGKDLSFAIRKIEEKFRRFKVRLSYYSLLVDTAPLVDLAHVVGDSSYTRFDPLWGESVALSGVDSLWVQPHLVSSGRVGSGSGVSVAEVSDCFDDPVLLYCNVQRDAQDLDLKRWGFDRIRDLIVHIPLSFLDAASIKVKAGDKFSWSGEYYDVAQWTTDGYYFNTNVRLYMVINATHRRRGS